MHSTVGHAKSLIVALTLASAGCSKFALLDALVPSGAIATHDIAYGEGPRRTLDLYRPREAKADQTALPVVVFFYGGDWQGGRKADYRFVAQAMTSNGFIAVVPDTRLFPEVIFPHFIEDAAAAVRWTHDHAARFGGDPTKIFLMGHSSGAHVAALLALDRRYLDAAGVPTDCIRGAALLSGPYDFVPNAGDRAVFAMRDGDAIDPNIEPIHFVRPDAPPLLIIHGLKDDIVNPDNAQHLDDAMHAVGGDARRIEYSRRGHADVALSFAYPFHWLAPVVHDVTTFFRSKLTLQPNAS